MLTLTKTTRPEIPCAIAGYEALDSMWHLTRTANSTERRELLEQLLLHDVVEICLDVSPFNRALLSRLQFEYLESPQSPILHPSPGRGKPTALPGIRELSW